MSTGGAVRASGGQGIAVRVTAPSWRRAVPDVAAKVRRWAAAALGCGSPAADLAGEVTVVLAGDTLVHRLNRTYRGKDKPTNVLSFPSGGREQPPGPEQPLGDIVIALGTTRAEARAAGKKLADHLAHLVIHGALHLLGYDHERPGPARRMERLEARLLSRFGIADPYLPRPLPRTPARRAAAAERRRA